MSLLENKGVQMMLAQLLKNAAPQLGQQVEEIGNVVIAFKQQLDRIEAQQKLILDHLNGDNNGPGIESGTRQDRRTSNGA